MANQELTDSQLPAPGDWAEDVAQDSLPDTALLTQEEAAPVEETPKDAEGAGVGTPKKPSPASQGTGPHGQKAPQAKPTLSSRASLLNSGLRHGGYLTARQACLDQIQFVQWELNKDPRARSLSPRLRGVGMLPPRLSSSPFARPSRPDHDADLKSRDVPTRALTVSAATASEPTTKTTGGQQKRSTDNKPSKKSKKAKKASTQGGASGSAAPNKGKPTGSTARMTVIRRMCHAESPKLCHNCLQAVHTDVDRTPAGGCSRPRASPEAKWPTTFTRNVEAEKKASGRSV